MELIKQPTFETCGYVNKSHYVDRETLNGRCMSKQKVTDSHIVSRAEYSIEKILW